MIRRWLFTLGFVFVFLAALGRSCAYTFGAGQ